MALMFNKNDVEAAGHPLVRLFRLIFYKNGVTIDGFTRMVAEHGRRLGRTPAMINTARNNHRSTSVGKDEITWRFFHFAMLNLLQLDIEEVILVVRTENGELVKIGSNDPVDPPRRTEGEVR
jgi:hypothetical protein